MSDNKNRDVRKCNVCRGPFVEDFKQVADLKDSGLQIFAHKEKTGERTPSTRRTYILHNTSERKLQRPEYIKEIVQYRTKCYQCKLLINTVRNLIDDINEMKDNEIRGICEICKNVNPAGKCKRCEAIVNKFLCKRMKQYADRQARYKLWITKVNELLTSILNSENICQHPLFKQSIPTAELEKLLKELESPVKRNEPNITEFPSPRDNTLNRENVAETRNKLQSLITKIKSDSENLPTIFPESSWLSIQMESKKSCICRHFGERKLGKFPKISDRSIKEDDEKEILTDSSTTKIQFDASLKESKLDKENISSNVGLGKKRSDSSSKERSSKSNKDLLKKRKVKSAAELDKLKEGDEGKSEISDKGKLKKKKVKSAHFIEDGSKDKKSKASDEGKKGKSDDVSQDGKEKKEKSTKSVGVGSVDAMFKKLMKEKQVKKVEKEKAHKELFAKVEPLPVLKSKPKRRIQENFDDMVSKSDSVFECDQPEPEKREMIEGTAIVPYRHSSTKMSHEMKPLLFNVYATSEANITEKEIEPSNSLPPISTPKKMADLMKTETSFKGMIKYRLSDREFIKKGWTVLPTSKVMRRMNIYKMEPQKPGTNWFERHEGVVLYDTGEILAEIYPNGNGKWFYKNGAIALDYYKPEEDNASKRIIVYSSPDEIDNGKNIPVTVLGCFDYLGNGVVYNHYGTERLKYNQTEGIVIDRKIGPPGRWKWHTLNDPPITREVFVNTYVESPIPCIDELLHDENKHSHEQKDSIYNADKPTPNLDMLTIELENFAKEQKSKMEQKFKRFEIRNKFLKLNQYFSLRIINQANIYLLFNSPPESLKLNLGLLLKSTEIIDSETNDFYDVVTPYDRIPPKTGSVANIQSKLYRAKINGSKIQKPV